MTWKNFLKAATQRRHEESQKLAHRRTPSQRLSDPPVCRLTKYKRGGKNQQVKMLTNIYRAENISAHMVNSLAPAEQKAA